MTGQERTPAQAKAWALSKDNVREGDLRRHLRHWAQQAQRAERRGDMGRLRYCAQRIAELKAQTSPSAGEQP